MIRISPLLCCVLCMLVIHAFAEEPRSVPDGPGQLETAPALFRVGVDDDGREYFVNGQPAKNGKLILTASNGFFTPRVCRASGESSLQKTGDDGLIAPNYAILSNWKKTDGTIRWHLWLARPGQVRFNVHLNVVEKAAGSKLSVSIGGVTHQVETVASRPEQPQPWNLSFDVEEPGGHTFEMAALKIANSQTGVGDVHRIDVYGPAVQDSQLLRARWRGGKPIRHLQPGSFCEVPGPPNVQRTGDVPREVRRRGWFRDELAGRWAPMDRFLCRGKGTLNKSWFVSSEGEFVMRTGGMRHYVFQSPAVAQTNMPLPEYLSPEATKQLQRLPAEFGEVDAVEVTDTTVNLDINMKRAGTNARADIYYGEKDCLTFAKRELHATERGSSVSRSTQAEDRCWSKQVSIASLKDGRNRITITGLKPGTTWFYRILVTNDEGKLWTFETHNFRTGDTTGSGS